MADRFTGAASALSEDGFDAVCDALGVKAAEVWAVIAVETQGCGYLAQRSPQILFERHWFHKFTDGLFDAQRPDLSDSSPGGYAGGMTEYVRLNDAIALHAPGLSSDTVEEAALKATSWGLGQIMGFNFKQAGYGNVRAMVTAALLSEDAQLLAFADFLKGNKLNAALRSHNWALFARGYNGPDFAKNSYDQRLAAQHARYTIGPLPDLLVRTAQLYLTYLGYQPRSIDGVLGRFTLSALQAFQADHGLSPINAVDTDVIGTLKNALAASGVPALETEAV